MSFFLRIITFEMNDVKFCEIFRILASENIKCTACGFGRATEFSCMRKRWLMKASREFCLSYTIGGESLRHQNHLRVNKTIYI